MPRKVGTRFGRVLVPFVIVVLLVGFTPISGAVLRAVNGSFTPTPFSSLALKTPSDVAVGLVAGKQIPVRLTNMTGHLETYHWSARQKGSLISLGEETLKNGHSTTIIVPSGGATAGSLRIALSGTSVFITVPLLKS
jgi:hypothetical protein